MIKEAAAVAALLIPLQAATASLAQPADVPGRVATGKPQSSTGQGASSDEADPSPANPPPDSRDGGDSEAGDPEDAGRQQPENAIVVTARKLDAARMRIDQSLGATVYLLNNETIEKRPGGETGSLTSILEQAPGAGLSSSALSIRGSSAVQVRINGVLLPETLPDPADQLSSRLAETTQLIAGTLPAQFGFAPGGVIDVKTKNGLYLKGGQAEMFVGSRGWVQPALEWAGAAANTSLFVTGSAERGRSRLADAGGVGAAQRRSEQEGLVFADHVIGPSDRVSFIMGGARQRLRIGATTLPKGIEHSDDIYGVGVYQHHSGPFAVQAAATLARASERADFGVADEESRRSAGMQLDASYEAGPSHRLGAGLMLTRLTGQRTGARSQSRTPLDLYVQDQWRLTTELTVNLGLRSAWLRGIGKALEVQPQASLVWDSGDGFSAHAGYARYAAAAPPEDEGAFALPIERDNYFDAGVQHKQGPWTLGVDVYSRSVRNLIEERRVPGEAGASGFTFARGRLRGIELSATYARGVLSAWANLSLSGAKARTINGGFDLFPGAVVAASDHWLPLAKDRPLVASGGASWRLGKFNLSGDVLAGSGAVRTLAPLDPNGSRASPFVTLGLAAIYHARFLGSAADLRLDLINLTGVHYLRNDARNLEGDWTRRADGRTILIGIEQGF